MVVDVDLDVDSNSRVVAGRFYVHAHVHVGTAHAPIGLAETRRPRMRGPRGPVKPS